MLWQEPLGGACSTTVITTVRVGDFEGSAFVLDFVQIFKRIITFPVQNDGNLIGLMARIRQRIGFLQEQGKLAASGAYSLLRFFFILCNFFKAVGEGWRLLDIVLLRYRCCCSDCTIWKAR